jgi:hypothetical protein
LGNLNANPDDKKQVAGVLPKKWGVLESIIEGAILAAWNQGHASRGLSGGVRGDSEAMTWEAIMDGRTCEYCATLNGKSWDARSYEPLGHKEAYPGPLAHWRCRCTQSVGAEGGDTGVEWEQWLKTQDYSLVTALAGTLVTKRLREGTLTRQGFQEQWSRPIDLRKLIELDEEYLQLY